MAYEPLPQDRETLHSLSGSLGRLQRTLGLARPDTVLILTDAWPQLVGARLAGICRLHSVQGTELVVEAQDPAVAEHLRWQGADLIAAANELCGCTVLSELRVTVARRA